MKLGISYEQALAKARPGLRYRMEQSVSLIRKAEALALRYDADNGFFLAFSGGKDSQALYHIVQLAGVRFQAHFSPTTVDPPQVIRFIRRNYKDVIFEKVDKSIFQVAKEMGMVPTMKLRWCCAKFKETAGAGKVTLTGIRRAESIKRAKRQSVEVSGHKFSGNLDEFMGWSKERIEKKVKNLNQDEFTRGGQDSEIRCINGKDSIIVNPMLEWTDRDVWDFLNDVCQVPHCELYDPPYNQHRIGCILCPMSSHRQKLKDCQMYPHIKRKWLDVFEYFIGGRGYTPEYRNQSRSIYEQGANLPLVQSSMVQGSPQRLYAERAEQIRKEQRTRNGKPRWGKAGVSMSAQVLFDWWLTHDTWEEFKAKRELPSLFDED